MSKVTILVLLILDQEIKPFERKTGIKGVPKGELITEKKSPNQKIIFRLYETTGDATVGIGRIGEVESTKDNIRKVVYQSYPNEKNEINWITNNKLIVNGKTLNVKKDVFNYKRHLNNFFKGYYSKNK